MGVSRRKLAACGLFRRLGFGAPPWRHALAHATPAAPSGTRAKPLADKDISDINQRLDRLIALIERAVPPAVEDPDFEAADAFVDLVGGEIVRGVLADLLLVVRLPVRHRLGRERRARIRRVLVTQETEQLGVGWRHRFGYRRTTLLEEARFVGG